MRRLTLTSLLLTAALLAGSSPARAQWTIVRDLPASDVFSLWANADTIVAGTLTTTFVSTNAGATWHESSRVTPAVPLVTAVRLRNGRLFAGTTDQGVFVSDDLGDTWADFNQGLVGGIFDSQLHISDFELRGDSLYAATLGAGVYVRPLVAGGTWHPFGDAFEANQAANVSAIALGGDRLVAAAGSNGTVFRRDPADGEWTQSLLKNVILSPGTQAQSVIFNGNGWVVGAVSGVFRSAAGQEPWTLFNPGLGAIQWSAFAVRGRELSAAFNITNDVVLENSDDDGASWKVEEHFPFKFIYRLAASRGVLYAARADGLFRDLTPAVSVDGDGAHGTLRFGLVGPQPVGDQVRFRIESPEAGALSIDVFDVSGRRAAPTIQSVQAQGTHEIAWDARALAPGVYLARLTEGNRHQTIRLVRAR